MALQAYDLRHPLFIYPNYMGSENVCQILLAGFTDKICVCHDGREINGGFSADQAGAQRELRAGRNTNAGSRRSLDRQQKRPALKE